MFSRINLGDLSLSDCLSYETDNETLDDLIDESIRFKCSVSQLIDNSTNDDDGIPKPLETLPTRNLRFANPLTWN